MPWPAIHHGDVWPDVWLYIHRMRPEMRRYAARCIYPPGVISGIVAGCLSLPDMAASPMTFVCVSWLLDDVRSV